MIFISRYVVDLSLMKTRRDFTKLILLFPFLKFDTKIRFAEKSESTSAQIIERLALVQNFQCAYFSKGMDFIDILKAKPKLAHPNIFLNDDVDLNLQDMLAQVERLKLTGTSINFVIIENQNRPATVINLDILGSSEKQNSLG